MTTFGLRQAIILAVGLGMISAGLIGLFGGLGTQPLLLGALLIAIAVISFQLGQMYAQPGRT